jgi:hypothetical protein
MAMTDEQKRMALGTARRIIGYNRNHDGQSMDITPDEPYFPGWELSDGDVNQKNSSEHTSTYSTPQFYDQTFVTIPYKPGDPGDGGRGKM